MKHGQYSTYLIRTLLQKAEMGERVYVLISPP